MEFIINATVTVASTVVGVLGWQTTALLVGATLCVYSGRMVDVENKSWFGYTSKVMTTEEKTIRVPSTSMFGLWGKLGFTEPQVVREQVVKRSMRAPQLFKVGVALILGAMTWFALTGGGVIAWCFTGVAVLIALKYCRDPAHAKTA